jgi:hypothetical protein
MNLLCYFYSGGNSVSQERRGFWTYQAKCGQILSSVACEEHAIVSLNAPNLVQFIII